MITNVPQLLLACLFVLTVFLEVVSPVDTLAQLVVPCLTWPILLAVGAVQIAFSKGVESEAENTGERNGSKIAVCLLLANVSSAVINQEEGTLWPYVAPSSLSY